MRPADNLIAIRDRVLTRHRHNLRGPEAATLDHRRPAEDVTRRTASGKVWHLAGNSYHLSQRIGAVHYQTDDGRLEEIDTAWEPADQPGDVAVMRRGPYVATVPAGQIGWRHESRRGGWMQLELLAVDGQPVTRVPEPRVEGDQVFWDAVAPGVDIKITAWPESSEAFKRYDGPHELEWRVTQWGGFAGRLQQQLRGWDRAGDRAEVLVERSGDRLRERWTGRVSKVADRRTRRKQWREHGPGAGRVIVDAAISEPVAFGEDDGAEIVVGATTGWDGYGFGYGSMYVRNNLQAVSPTYPPSSLYRNGGARWRELPIPSGSTVIAASVTLDVGGIVRLGEPNKLLIYADDVDDAALWSAASRPSQMSRTSSYGVFTKSGPLGYAGQPVIDMQAAIAQVLARPGWQSGNALRVGLFAAYPDQDTGVNVWTHYGPGHLPSLDPPQLDVTFEPGGGVAHSGWGVHI